MVLPFREVGRGEEAMKKIKPEKSKAELDREEREHKEFLAKNSREVEKYLVDCCERFGLDFEPPFSDEEVKEIMNMAKQEELGKLLKMFPNFNNLGEWEQLSAKCILKFGLDPKKFSLARKDWPKINEAISQKLKGSSDSAVNPELCRFRKG